MVKRERPPKRESGNRSARKAPTKKRPPSRSKAQRAAAPESQPASPSTARSARSAKPEDRASPLPRQGEDTLSAYLREIREFALLSREEEHELGLKAKQNDEDAFNKLVRSNLRYVVSVANRYKGFGLSLEDLINEGNIGLIHAVRRFDPSRGVKLITYAVWWIRQSIMHAIADHTGTVRLPIKQAGLIYKISRAYQDLHQQLDRDPGYEELAAHLNMKLEDIENIMRVYRSYLSLDAPITENDETSYLDLLEEKNAISAEENLFRHSLEEEIDELLKDLDPRERQIIRMRFGFEGEPMTLEEIAQKIGLSRERIRQIEKKTIRRFRARARNKTLLEYLR